MRGQSYSTQSSEIGGGRVLVLLLLFALSLYQFYSSGIGAFAAICLTPLIAIVAILAFRQRQAVFWALVIINFFLQMKSIPWPGGVPMSLYNEGLEILLIMMIIIDVKDTKFQNLFNIMLVALVIWCSFCTLQLLNDTCGLGMNVSFWYTGARLMAFQLLYGFIVFALYIDTPEKLMKYLVIWGAMSFFAVFWIWKQKNMGFTQVENQWIQGRGRRTHILNGGATIRYFSVYSDAASCGINLASAAVAFIIFGITAKIRKYRYVFLVVGVGCAWGMFPSGTRTAIFCLLAGFAVYTVLAKSFKLTLLIGSAGLIIFFILAFTKIGDGNPTIRRMRTAFDPTDASAAVRDINKAAIKKYLAEAPFGLGIGNSVYNIPPNNKYAKLSNIPPDSEYVFIWVHTGIVGLSIFVFTTGLMFVGAARVVMFDLKSPSLRGIGAGLSCSFVSMQLGGYANQVLMQFPNCLIFYGGLTLVYVLPLIEQQWFEYENAQLASQAEKDRIKEEKKRAKRV